MRQSQVILITGASSGFGKISAQMLADKGYIVYGTSRNTERIDNKVTILQMDVTDKQSVFRTVERIICEQGRIDVLINNAGIGISGALELATSEEISIQMNTNFLGVVYMCQAVLPYMREARNGKIINISSIGGRMGIPYQGFYSASKFAVEGYSEALAMEVYPFNIHICLIEPGDFNTGFTANRNISKKTLLHPEYSNAFTQAMKIIEHEEINGSSPRKFAKVLCKLVDYKHPPFRTQVGAWKQTVFLRCKKWLPAKCTQTILRFYYNIKKMD